MTKTKLSQKMEEVLVHAADRGYRGTVNATRRTETALLNRGLITLDHNVRGAVGNPWLYPVLTVAGWAWLKAEHNIDRPADEGRATVEEALADVTWVGGLGISETEYVACLKSWARHGTVPSLASSDYAFIARMRGDIERAGEDTGIPVYRVTQETPEDDADPFEPAPRPIALPDMTKLMRAAYDAALNRPYGRLPAGQHPATIQGLKDRGLVVWGPVSSPRAYGPDYRAWVLTRKAFGHVGRKPVADPGRMSLGEALDVAYTPAETPEHTRAPGCCPEDDAVTYVGTVAVVGQTAVRADFTDFPGEGVSPRMLIYVGYGHGLNEGSLIRVNAEGIYVLAEQHAAVLAEQHAAVLAEANRITHDRDAARVKEAESFSALSPLAQQRAAVPYATAGRVDGRRVKDGPAVDLYVDRNAWKATSAALDDIAQAMHKAQTVAAERAPQVPPPAHANDDPRSADMVWRSDGRPAWPVLYLDTPIPRDLADDWFGLDALSWSRGVLAHWAASRSIREAMGK